MFKVCFKFYYMRFKERKGISKVESGWSQTVRRERGLKSSVIYPSSAIVCSKFSVTPHLNFNIKWNILVFVI